jgi:hypothetical protein
MTQVMSRCPECGARVYVGAGSPTPAHVSDNTGKPCPGEGKPSL